MSNNDIEEIAKKTLIWYQNFKISTFFINLKPQAKFYHEKIILDFLSYSYFKYNLVPEQWDNNWLEIYCYEVIPEERALEDEDYYKNISPVLEKFFLFLHYENLLINSHKLANKIIELSEDFSELYHFDFESDTEDKILMDEGIIDNTLELINLFTETSRFGNLNKMQKAESENIIIEFALLMAENYELGPDSWNESSLIDCLENYVPRSMIVTSEKLSEIIPVITEFIKFLSDSKYLKNGLRIANNLEVLNEEIITKSQNKDNWDSLKKLLIEAQEKGINIENEPEIDQLFLKKKGIDLKNLP